MKYLLMCEGNNEETVMNLLLEHNIMSISNSGFVQYLKIFSLNTICSKSDGISNLSFCLSPIRYMMTG